MSIGNIAKGKSYGRPTVATPDGVGNSINQVFEENPHISLRHLSQQIEILRSIVNISFQPFLYFLIQSPLHPVFGW